MISLKDLTHFEHTKTQIFKLTNKINFGDTSESNVSSYLLNAICAIIIVGVGRMSWFKTGATHYHAKLGLPGVGLAIKGLNVCISWDVITMTLIKRYGFTLLSTVPRGMNHVSKT